MPIHGKTSSYNRLAVLIFLLAVVGPFIVSASFAQATEPEGMRSPQEQQINPRPAAPPIPPVTGNLPGPNTRPMPQQTANYIDSNPNLRTLDPSLKQALIYNQGNLWLNSPQLPNGQPNPLYQNGQLTPNWYILSTWQQNMNWKGVQPNGFLPVTSPTAYSSSSAFAPSVYNPTTNYLPTTVPRYQPPPQPTSTVARNPSSPVANLSPLQPRNTVSTSTIKPPGTLDASVLTKMAHDHQTALSLSQTAGDKIGVMVHATALAQLFVAQGKPTQALLNLAVAEPFVTTASDPRARVDFLRTAFTAHMQAGEFEKALADNGKVLPILLSLKDDAGRAETYLSSAWADQSLGDIPHAIGAYEAAISLFSLPPARNDDGLARARIGLGSLYQSLGERVKALQQYKAALPLASKPQIARIMVSYAEILQANGLEMDAIVAYKKALQLAREDGDVTFEAAVLTGLGRAWMSMRNFREAERQFAEARSLVDNSSNPSAKAGVIASQGEMNYWMAISINASRENPQVHLKKALEHYSEVLPLMRAAGDRYGEIGVLTNSGLVFDAEGKTKEALGFYLQALQKMEDLQTLARLEEFRSSLADQSAGLYVRAIQLKIQSHQLDEAFELSERARARMFLDQLGNAHVDDSKQAPPEFSIAEKELRHENISLERQLGQELAKPGPELNAERIEQLRAQVAAVRASYAELFGKLKLANPAYASFLSVSPASVTEAQKLLDPSTTIVSYFIGPDFSFAFILTKTSLKVKKLNVNALYLFHEVSAFRDFANDDVVSPSLRVLYKTLIGPLRSELKTAKLVVIPHGVLHDLPFGALTPDGRHFLSDDYLISYSPSVSALSYLHPKASPSPIQALVLANDQNQGLPRLNSADDEARNVAAILDTTPLLGEQATPRALREHASNYDILHLVAHFEVDRKNPMASKILLGRTGNNDDNSLDLAGIYTLSLHNTGLVVLSGCQSQTGKRTRGDDIASLSRAFLYAGSPSVIASLWSVDDDATRQLMVSFYTHLKSGLSKAESLRAAQTDVRRRYPNPFFWAGFVLTGDPGPVTISKLIAAN
jgi:CHAT domain-containing protein/Tfp pilus assembly protein PilF